MDNHPIPQDITGFQFKLIGNMTVRQFVYLAIGAVLAWLFFFVIDFPTLIKWPLSLISISAGAIFAFVPIDGRPMDTMVSNFIKAILAPTEFIYQKEGMKMENQAVPPHSQPLHLPHLHMPTHHQNTPVTGFKDTQDVAQMTPPAPVTAPAAPAPEPTPSAQVLPPALSPNIQAAPAPIPNNPPVVPTMTIEGMDDPGGDLKGKNKELRDLKDENKGLEKELEDLKKQLEEAMRAKDEALKTPPPAPVPPPAVALPPEPTLEQKELERQLTEANRQRVALQNELLQQQAKAQAPTQAVAPSVAPIATPTQRVRSIPQGMEKAAGIPSIPEAPNLITGIVKDPRGNPLQSILIEVKDQDSNPVRAFKTNGLGKFASATSLSNGKYLITFEDPKETNKFDAVEIELVGAPVMPLEIFSVDPREELRRELFK